MEEKNGKLRREEELDQTNPAGVLPRVGQHHQYMDFYIECLQKKNVLGIYKPIQNISIIINKSSL